MDRTKYILLITLTAGAFVLLGAKGDEAQAWTFVGILATGLSLAFAWFRSTSREPAVLVGVVVATAVGLWRYFFGDDEALRFQEVLMMLAPLATAWIARAFVTPAPKRA